MEDRLILVASNVQLIYIYITIYIPLVRRGVLTGLNDIKNIGAV